MTELSSAFITIIPSMRGAKGVIERELSGVSGAAGLTAGKRMGGGMVAGIGGSLKGMAGSLGLLLGAQAVGSFFSGAVSGASDLAESGNKIDAIFGSAAKSVQQFAAGGPKALGQTKLATLDAAATFGTFGKAAGLSGKGLSKFSTGFASLSTDLASFYNSSPEEAVQAIGAALRGEAEPIRRFGVLLDDATLRNEALRLGLISTTKDALTPQQKVLAAQAAIYRQTKDAQGDFAKTSGGLANQQRILSAQWEDLKTNLGASLLPAVTSVVTAINDSLFPALDGIGSAIEPAKDAFKSIFDLVVKGDFTGGLRKAFGLEEDSGIVTGVLTIRDGVIKGFNAVVEFIKTRVVPAFSRIYDSVKGLVSTVWPVVSSFVSGMAERLAPLMPVVSGIFGAIGDIVVGAMDLISTTISTVTGWIKSAWDNWGTGLMDTVSTVFGAFLSVVQPALDVVKGVIEAVTKAIRGDWSGAWSAVTRTLGAAWETIENAVSGSVRILQGILSTAWDAIKSVASAAWGRVTDAVKSAVTGLIDFVKSIPGRIVSALGDLGSLLWDSGQQVVGGLMRGVADAGGRFVAWLKQWIVDHIPGPIRSALGIASPSKVTAKLGEYTAQGLAVGLERATSSVEQAARRAASAMAVGSATPRLAGVTGAGGASARAVFHLYDADGVLLGTMQGAAQRETRRQARAVLAGVR